MGLPGALFKRDRAGMRFSLSIFFLPGTWTEVWRCYSHLAIMSQQAIRQVFTLRIVEGVMEGAWGLDSLVELSQWP